jgi:ribosomal protein L22
MSKKQRKFADDGWAVWIDGDDTSTVYINDWLNPKGKSYIDIAVRIRGVKVSKALHVYLPFTVSRDEIKTMLQEKRFKKTDNDQYNIDIGFDWQEYFNSVSRYLGVN